MSSVKQVKGRELDLSMFSPCWSEDHKVQSLLIIHGDGSVGSYEMAGISMKTLIFC